MPFTKDPSYYQDDRSLELLADNLAFSKRNTLNPIAIHGDYEVASDALLAGIPLLITGEPGTCKTSTVINLGVREGVPVYIVPCNSSMPGSALNGKVVFNPHKGIDGDERETVFQPGPLLWSYANGAICVLDDGLQLKEGLMTEAMEFAMMPEIYNCVADGNIYHRHPNFRIVMTGNLGCVGTNKVPEALLDRFRVAIDVDRLSKKAFLMIGKSKWPWVKDDFFNQAYDLCTAVMVEAKNNAKKHVPCGIRQLEGLMGVIPQSGPLTLDQFSLRVKTTFINVLRKALLPSEKVEMFYTTPVVGAYISKMYNDYRASPKPIAPGMSQQAQAVQQQPQAQQPSNPPTPKSGMDLFDDLYGTRI